MQILQGIDGLKRLPPGCVLSIGNFDGMHRGHARILQQARELAAALPAASPAAAAGIAVVTFEPHPLTVLRPALAPPRLTPPILKQHLLAEAQARWLVTLAPTRPVLDLTAEHFWRILRDQVRPGHLVEGPTFTFGKGRSGTIDRLREWSAGSDVHLHVIDPVQVALMDMQVTAVTSSLIRWLLSYGRVRDAAICLGRPYALCGEVVPGHRRGRELGVPTANLRCEDQLIPDDGVYAGRCAVDGRTWPAAVSIGTLPTFGENQRQIEAHLIGYDGDLYGQTLQLELLDWLREQRKYRDIDALKAQLRRDLDECAARSHLSPQTPVAALA